MVGFLTQNEGGLDDDDFDRDNNAGLHVDPINVPSVMHAPAGPGGLPAPRGTFEDCFRAGAWYDHAKFFPDEVARTTRPSVPSTPVVSGSVNLPEFCGCGSTLGGDRCTICGWRYG